MLPPLLLTVSRPPAAMPTAVLSRPALPVPPPVVLTVTETAPLVAFVVLIVPAVCASESFPEPSVLAARVIVPEPARTPAPTFRALAALTETLPLTEIGPLRVSAEPVLLRVTARAPGPVAVPKAVPADWVADRVTVKVVEDGTEATV